MNTNDWTNELRHKLADYEVAPDADLWEAVQQRLGEAAAGEAPVDSAAVDAAGEGRARKGRVVPLFWRRLAVAASVLFLVAGTAYLAFFREHTAPIVGEQVDGRELTARPVGTAADNAAPLLLAEKTPATASTGRSKPTTTKLAEKTAVEAMLPASGTQPEAIASDAIGGKARHDEPAETAPHATPTIPPAPPTATPAPPTAEPPAHSAPKTTPAPARRPTASRLMAAATPRVAMGVYMQGYNGSSPTATPVLMSQRLLADFNGAAARMAPTVYLSNYEERSSHDVPLSLGLTATIGLPRRWQLSAGVVYTRLQATFTTITPASAIVRTQRLHYVGVPLQAQHSLWHTKWLNTYAGAGIEADVNVASAAATNGVKQTAPHDRMRLAALLSAGVQCRVVPRLSAYCEPSLRCNIGNGSSVENYFSENRLGLSLQFGLRFDLKPKSVIRPK